MLLCENQEGYRNLINLVSTGYLEGFYYKPRIDKDLLAAHSKGLIAMSACLRGDINETILADKYDEARRLAYTYTRHLRQGTISSSKSRTTASSRTSASPRRSTASRIETGIPLVATNDSHYLRRDDARAHEILMCIQTGKTMTDPNRMHWDHPDFYLKSRDEMMELFGELEDAVNRPWEIAQRCQVKLEKVKEPFPKFDVPPRALRPIPTSRTSPAQGFEKRRPRLEALRAAGRAQARSARVHRAAGPRDPHDPADEVLRLLPHRLGFHPLREIRIRFPSARAAARPPAAWSATRWRSPISIRCSTACCSSAS